MGSSAPRTERTLRTCELNGPFELVLLPSNNHNSISKSISQPEESLKQSFSNYTIQRMNIVSKIKTAWKTFDIMNCFHSHTYKTKSNTADTMTVVSNPEESSKASSNTAPWSNHRAANLPNDWQNDCQGGESRHIRESIDSCLPRHSAMSDSDSEPSGYSTAITK